jgi:hypothetical protein
MKKSRHIHLVLSTFTLGLGVVTWVSASSAYLARPLSAAEEPSGSAAPPPADPEDGTAGHAMCDDAAELGEMVCPKPTWGMSCMMACARYGVPCPAEMTHTITHEVGTLFKCCNCKEDQRCWYTYSNGTFCVYRRKVDTLYCGI